MCDRILEFYEFNVCLKVISIPVTLKPKTDQDASAQGTEVWC